MTISHIINKPKFLCKIVNFCFILSRTWKVTKNIINLVLIENNNLMYVILDLFWPSHFVDLLYINLIATSSKLLFIFITRMVKLSKILHLVWLSLFADLLIKKYFYCFTNSNTRPSSITNPFGLRPFVTNKINFKVITRLAANICIFLSGAFIIYGLHSFC